MTKKHYLAIAEKINLRVSSINSSENMNGDERAAALNAVSGVVNDIAEIARVDNTRFNRARFMAACGTN